MKVTFIISVSNLIELYSKIKYYGYKKIIFLNGNPFDTFFCDDLFEIHKICIYRGLKSYSVVTVNQDILSFIFNVIIIFLLNNIDARDIMTNTINTAWS